MNRDLSFFIQSIFQNYRKIIKFFGFDLILKNKPVWLRLGTFLAGASESGGGTFSKPQSQQSSTKCCVN